MTIRACPRGRPGTGWDGAGSQPSATPTRKERQITTLPHYISAPHPGTHHLETQAVDIYVLATRVVHRAETLLAGADRNPEAVARIEMAFTLALSVTADSTWADVRAAREHLDMAQEKLELSAYWLG